ncbi:MarR family winged helix-turn-helix transcriptional regulator [Actinomadura sp. HBU206391]|uniref:MarR family winged helix-turn-helix transcriptional regulator n=1 Tax=Actinomadura sp. HBU206391 TaxID=2731692 RepID=UPI00164FB46D|nr:MarR family transcriptional regulator [Actinomadura sp. HBU206391]MBC6458358.1 winged helix DNA-binding protein [Actinomadura sp. HBU206391]
MSAEADPVVADLTDLVFQVAGRLRAGFNATAAELDLPPAQALALANLRSPAPMRELAEWLACDASNVTGIVDGLERRGLVTRQPDPTDRRVKHLVLTEAGERKRAALRSRSHATAIELFNLPGDDRLRLRDLLAQVQADSVD